MMAQRRGVDGRGRGLLGQHSTLGYVALVGPREREDDDRDHDDHRPCAPRELRDHKDQGDDEAGDDEAGDDEVGEELPQDEPSGGRAPSGPAELTGMDLIQRELGGQVIGEFEG